jgi:hypothetical protein
MRQFLASPAAFFSPIRSRKMHKTLPSLSKAQGGSHASSKLSPSSAKLPASSSKLALGRLVNFHAENQSAACAAEAVALLTQLAKSSDAGLQKEAVAALGRLVNCHAENRYPACAAPASSSKVPVSPFKLPASDHPTDVKRSERFPESVDDEVAECDGGTASVDRKRARELQCRGHLKEIPRRNSNFLKRMKSCTRKACERCRERKASCDGNTPCGKCVKSFEHIQAMGELSLFSFRTPEEMCFRSARKQYGQKTLQRDQ